MLNFQTPKQKEEQTFTVSAKNRHIIHILKNGFIVFLFLLIGLGNASATNYYQRQSGNWNNPYTWTTSNGWMATTNTGTYPQAGDNVYFANNGSTATITLTADAECANMSFDGSDPASVIAMGNYNLIVDNSWTTNWSSQTTLTQGTGYLQVSAIPQFFTGKTIANFRVGSGSFSFVQSNSTTLRVTSNYDCYCYQSTIPVGIDATGATKTNATPCSPALSATALTSFGSVCTGSTSAPNSFTVSALALSNATVNISALTGFTYSTTTGGTYTSTLSLPQSGGHYSQTIYVKFSPVSSTSYNGNIVVSGGGATSINVAATGSGSNSVAPTISSPTVSNVTSSTATLGGTITLPGCADNATERGIFYSTTNGFADGAGARVSETGSFGAGAFTINVAGLTPLTTYYFKAFASNSNGTVYTAQGTFVNTITTYYSVQSGNWTSPTTWSTTGCGGVINSGTYPHGSDNVVLCQTSYGHAVTVDVAGLACNNLDMNAYACQLILNNDFTINGNLTLSNQANVAAGTHNLTINGNFANTPTEYYSRIDYSTGNISIGGNITVSKGGIEPFNCTGSGWLTLYGASKTFTANTAIDIPRFKQPATSFTKGSSGNITISNTFDQNWGPVAPSGIIISIPANTLNAGFKYFRSQNSGDWSNIATWQQSGDGASNWITATSIPSSPDGLVTIQNGHTVTLTSSAITNSVTINSGATLSVGADKQLTVSSFLTNNGSLKLLSDATGTATLLSQGTVSGTGSYKVQQYLSSIRNWYISSPMVNAAAPAGYTYFKYDEPGNNTGFIDPATAYWETVSVGTTLSPMVGYITLPTASPSTIEFTGTSLNNGNESISLTRTAGKTKEGFNLIGNPYPSYVNWTNATKINIDPSIWYRTKNNAGTFVFDTFNGIGTNNNQQGAVTGYIPPMQSVWVRVSTGQASGTLQFTNALRSHESGTNRLKAPSSATTSDKIVRLQVSNATNSDETVLRFNENASNAFDSYDAQKMTNASPTIPEIFTLADNEELAINAMSTLPQNTEIALGFRTGETTTFSMKASEITNLEPNTSVILKDNLLNKEVDLSVGNAYSFTSEATNSTSRFSIIFKTTGATAGVNNVGNAMDILIYKTANNQIMINYNGTIAESATVTIHNIIGQTLTTTKLAKSTVIHLAFKAGVYLITIINGGRTITQKLVID